MMATPDHEVGTERSELTAERSRRGSGRSLVARAGGGRRCEMKRVRNRRKKTGRRCCQKEIELRQEFLLFLLLLGLFARSHKFANRAGMFAIECFDKRRFERRTLSVAGDHRHRSEEHTS